MTVNIAFCFIHIRYRINLRFQPRRKMKVKGFNSGGMKCIAKPDESLLLERSTTGSCFIKPRVYWNLFHLPIEQELWKGKVWISQWSSKESLCTGININFTSCTCVWERGGCIFLLPCFKFTIVIWPYTENRPRDHSLHFIVFGQFVSFNDTFDRVSMNTNVAVYK